jgi:hypothetical protein
MSNLRLSSGFSVCRIVIETTTIFDGRQPPAGYDGHGRLAISYVLESYRRRKLVYGVDSREFHNRPVHSPE